jgi:hypothetical protein
MNTGTFVTAVKQTDRPGVAYFNPPARADRDQEASFEEIWD